MPLIYFRAGVHQTGINPLLDWTNDLIATEPRDTAALSGRSGWKKLPDRSKPSLQQIAVPQDTAVDIRLIQNTSFPKYSVTVDWSLLKDGTLDTDEQLATAVIVALGTDALASRDDLLPDPDSTDRAGWWGDLDAHEIWDGWPIGAKLWLLKRSKIEGPGSEYGSTVVRVEQYIKDAIQPFIDRRIASNVWVKAERTGREKIEALVRLYRGPRLAVELRYEVLWNDIIEA